MGYINWKNKINEVTNDLELFIGEMREKYQLSRDDVYKVYQISKQYDNDEMCDYYNTRNEIMTNNINKLSSNVKPDVIILNCGMKHFVGDNNILNRLDKNTYNIQNAVMPIRFNNFYDFKKLQIIKNEISQKPNIDQSSFYKEKYKDKFHDPDSISTFHRNNGIVFGNTEKEINQNVKKYINNIAVVKNNQDSSMYKNVYEKDKASEDKSHDLRNSTVRRNHQSRCSIF